MTMVPATAVDAPSEMKKAPRFPEALRLRILLIEVYRAMFT